MSYVVVASQINRWDNEANEGRPLARGTEFEVGDDNGVTDAELQRWLKLKPAVVVDTADIQDTQRNAQAMYEKLQEAEAENAKLRLQLAQHTSQAGVDHPADVAPDVPKSQIPPGDEVANAVTATDADMPAGNASADAWREWAAAAHPDNEDEDADLSRDELRSKYSGE